jgi:DNA polymerase-3 subunit epsilon
MAFWLSSRERARRRLRDPDYAFLLEPEHGDELVVLDTETTGLDRKRDEIVSLAAIRIHGNRLLTGEALRLVVRPERPPQAASVAVHLLRPMDCAGGISATEAVGRFLRFVGTRPLVGYFLEFDAAMIDRIMLPWLGIRLPQRQIELSSLYYDWVMARPTMRDAHYTGDVDLGFAAIMTGLGLPMLPAHDAFNDALMTGLAYVKLAALRQGG